MEKCNYNLAQMFVVFRLIMQYTGVELQFSFRVCSVALIHQLWLNYNIFFCYLHWPGVWVVLDLSGSHNDTVKRMSLKSNVLCITLLSRFCLIDFVFGLVSIGVWFRDFFLLDILCIYISNVIHFSGPLWKLHTPHPPTTPTSLPWHSPTLGHQAFTGSRASPSIC